MWAWKHPHHNGTLTYTKLEGKVVFNHVDFRYTPARHYTIRKAGTDNCLCGRNVSCENDDFNLINHFYDIVNEKIRYNGINTNKIKKADLRHSL